MARLFARVKSFPASPAVGRVLSLWQQTPGSIQNVSLIRFGYNGLYCLPGPEWAAVA